MCINCISIEWVERETMKKNYPKIQHIRIDLTEDLIYSHGKCLGRWSKWKECALSDHRELVMKYKLFSRYNFDKAGTIRHVIAWDSVVEEFIQNKLI